MQAGIKKTANSDSIWTAGFRLLFKFARFPKRDSDLYMLSKQTAKARNTKVQISDKEEAANKVESGWKAYNTLYPKTNPKQLLARPNIDLTDFLRRHEVKSSKICLPQVTDTKTFDRNRTETHRAA